MDYIDLYKNIKRMTSSQKEFNTLMNKAREEYFKEQENVLLHTLPILQEGESLPT
jgi:hypothetical protein